MTTREERIRATVVLGVVAALILVPLTAVGMSRLNLAGPVRLGPVTCSYEDGRLAQVKVRAPKVKSHRSAERQYARWDAYLERRTGSGRWAPVDEALATRLGEVGRRRFVRLREPSATFERDLSAGLYRVVVVVKWYEAGSRGRVVGRTALRSRRYVHRPAIEQAPERACIQPEELSSESASTVTPAPSPSPSPSSSATPSVSPSASTSPAASPSPSAPGRGVFSSPLWRGTAERALFGSTLTWVDTAVGRKPLAGDFDGDGHTDLLWYLESGLEELWWGSGSGAFQVTTSPVDVGPERLPMRGDFDGDGRDDVFWYAGGDIPDSQWWGSPSRSFDLTAIGVRGIYRPVWGDFDGDGYDDIFWYEPGEPDDAQWWGKPVRADLKAGATGVDISGVYEPFSGDFDGDGRQDIFLYGAGDAADRLIWGSPRAELKEDVSHFTVEGTYRAFSGDFDGDRRDDIFWFSPTGTDRQWWGTLGRRELGHFSTAASFGGDYLPVPAHFDTDGREDVLWYRL
ncbi:MAG: FG-GAP-like repeat-containing protein [Actinomycetota bacterium]|nr:FG-GAP-like repeat-containing protein [Actinomycetota bacterium]